MNKTRNLYLLLRSVLIFTFFISLFFEAKGDDQAPAKETANQLVNDECLKCHAHNKFVYDNTVTSTEVTHKMCSCNVINPELFYQSNHKLFKCTDCHSVDFKVWPHSAEVRMEQNYTCLDCHGGDERYAKFNFEEIERQFAMSVHSKRHSEEFTCWMCHDPHTYRLVAGSDSTTSEIVAYDNNICLSCHNNINKYQLIC